MKDWFLKNCWYDMLVICICFEDYVDKLICLLINIGIYLLWFKKGSKMKF